MWTTIAARWNFPIRRGGTSLHLVLQVMILFVTTITTEGHHQQKCSSPSSSSPGSELVCCWPANSFPSWCQLSATHNPS
eukprot:scaffold6293_cov163-Ochromonas_danica.AAC.1